MSITYCDGWFRAQNQAGELWTEDRARAAHDALSPYTALIGNAIRPWCFVEMTGDSMAVEFLDDQLRSYVCYHFQTEQPNRLFITAAIYREFVNETDRVKGGVCYYCKPDGTLTVKKEEYTWAEGRSYPLATTYTLDTHADMAANWEPYPAFGHYESITRLDRGLTRID